MEEPCVPGQLPPALLEAIVGYLPSVAQRAKLSLVCKHWDSVLCGSRSLWQHTKLFLDKLSQDDVPDLARWLAHRAAGIRSLELHFSDPAWWSSIAYLLGVVGPGLECLDLCGIDCAEDNLHWLAHLTSLQTLRLTDVLGTFHPCLTRLTALKELVVVHEEGTSIEYSAPPGLSALQQLTRLELRHGLTALPEALGTLRALRVLALEGADLYGSSAALDAHLAQLTGLEALTLNDCELAEFPMLAPLTRLTSLGLSNCFDGRPWGRLAWESRLSGLSALQQLAVLNLSGNSLPVVSSAITYLPRLVKLKVGLNPLTDGLAPGPYRALEHLDLHGSSITSLPVCLMAAQQLTFLGLSCCHSLELDRFVVESVIGKLLKLESITVCGSMLESVDSGKALLTLGRLLPRVELLSQDEVEEGSGGHHHDVADAHGNDYDYSDSEEEESDFDGEGTESDEGETDMESGEESDDGWGY